MGAQSQTQHYPRERKWKGIYYKDNDEKSTKERSGLATQRSLMKPDVNPIQRTKLKRKHEPNPRRVKCFGPLVKSKGDNSKSNEVENFKTHEVWVVNLTLNMWGQDYEGAHRDYLWNSQVSVSHIMESRPSVSAVFLWWENLNNQFQEWSTNWDRGKKGNVNTDYNLSNMVDIVFPNRGLSTCSYPVFVLETVVLLALCRYLCLDE